MLKFPNHLTIRSIRQQLIDAPSCGVADIIDSRIDVFTDKVDTAIAEQKLSTTDMSAAERQPRFNAGYGQPDIEPCLQFIASWRMQRDRTVIGERSAATGGIRRSRPDRRSTDSKTGHVSLGAFANKKRVAGAVRDVSHANRAVGVQNSGGR